jgi:hypothetical protein
MTAGKDKTDRERSAALPLPPVVVKLVRRLASSAGHEPTFRDLVLGTLGRRVQCPP